MGKKKATKAGAKKLYTLKVSLVSGPAHLGDLEDEISRTVQMRGNQALGMLHETLFDAFDREEEHMYAFELPDGRRYVPGADVELAAEEKKPAGDVADTTLASLALEHGQHLRYWFDFGDDWEHLVEVLAVEDAPERGHFPTVTNRVGDSPAQYPQWDDEGLEP